MDSGLLRYLLLRSLRALATVAGVVTLVFLLVHLIPGDPVDAILGDQAAPEDRAALRSALLLDRPLLEQYVAFARNVADGSLGQSFRERGRKVADLVRGVLPHTLVLATASLLPVVTVAAAQLGALLSGTVIAEKIFERPGLGTLFLQAFFDRDIPVVQGCVLVVALIYVGVNFAVDLLYGWVDPRVRLG